MTVKPAPACQSCRRFTLADATLLPRHRAIGLGHCNLDPRSYAFTSTRNCCARYAPTPVRAAWLQAHFPEDP